MMLHRRWSAASRWMSVAADAGRLTRADLLALPSVPVCSPSFPRGPYRFIDREYLILPYETDPVALRNAVPPPLRPSSNVVLGEWILMPDSSGFGSYYEAGLVVPCKLPSGEDVGFVQSMYLDCEPPIAAGRLIWGFPKKFAEPQFLVDRDTLVGKLNYGSTTVAIGSMAFKHRRADDWEALKALSKTQVLLKQIPDVDWSPKICQLVKFQPRDISIKEAWEGPSRLFLRPHVNAPWADLPVLRSLPGKHIKADLTLPFGEVAFDYMQPEHRANPEFARVLANPSMPLAAPTFEAGPIRLHAREHLRIIYETDRDALLKVLPEDMEMTERPTVVLEWITSSGSGGFGKYGKTTQFIECKLRSTGERVNFYLQSFVNTSSAITAGMEVFGQAQRRGDPGLAVQRDTVLGSLKYGSVSVAEASMAFKYQEMDVDEATRILSTPQMNVKIIPGVDGGCHDVCQLVKVQHSEVSVSKAYTGPARLDMIPHVNCTLADLPVRRIIRGEHVFADLTLPSGTVVRDYSCA